jgi:hypothetical protein
MKFTVTAQGIVLIFMTLCTFWSNSFSYHFNSLYPDTTRQVNMVSCQQTEVCDLQMLAKIRI